jgi:hypothetical protein
LLYAGEKVKATYAAAAPDIAQSQQHPEFQLVGLEALVTMKLTSFRLKDRVHLLDMIGVGIVDRSWLPILPPMLAERLQELLDNPEG